jgi:LmbE family N-acetylglucosaminyl deacetylase
VSSLRLPRLTLLVVLACACAGPTTTDEDAVAPGLPDDVLVTPRPDASGPRVLAIVAHPDDEIAFAGTLYKTSTFLDGVCDVAIVTNGEGGYKYATLAEDLYGQALTDEETGRRFLPDIRRREVTIGCRYLSVHRLFFLGQRDQSYTRDLAEVLGDDARIWDLAEVRAALQRILAEGDYDFVLTHGPTTDTHAHHRAATVLALQAVEALPAGRRPIVLGVRWSKGDEVPTTEVLDGYPITAVEPGPAGVFDRTQSFGYRGRLDYRIVVNWAISAHKSQGTMQLLTGASDRENYFVYAMNPPGSVERTAAFFEALAAPQFETTWDDEADGATGGAAAARSERPSP